MMCQLAKLLKIKAKMFIILGYILKLSAPFGRVCRAGNAGFYDFEI